MIKNTARDLAYAEIIKTYPDLPPYPFKPEVYPSLMIDYFIFKKPETIRKLKQQSALSEFYSNYFSEAK